MTDFTQILVVDDDPLVLSGFKEVLSRAGYSVEACTSGQEALDRLATSNYRIVLTDLFMPRVTGMDVLNAALAADPDTILAGYRIIHSYSSSTPVFMGNTYRAHILF